MSLQKSFQLKSGANIPSIGFGTWQLKEDIAVNAVLNALNAGYRHIDTADYYDNHKQIRTAISKSGIAREDIFLTTKVWRTDLAKQDVLDNTVRYLEELDTDYIDMLLIHWPNKDIDMQQTLEAFKELKNTNKIKHFGVSNFSINNLKNALDMGFEVENNQIELHPMLNQSELHEYCKQNGILLTAYSPLGTGESVNIELIQQLANKYSKTPAQIILNWILSRGIVVIPKSTNILHMQQNIAATDFEIETDDINKIGLLGTESTRYVNPSFADWS